MPPKRLRGGWSLEYHSSEDEDYLPPGSPPQPSASKSKRSSSRHQHQNQDDDLPLAQCRHALQQSSFPTDGPSTVPQKLTDGRKLDFKFEVPEEVLHNILLHLCIDHGAIPSAAIALCINKSWRNAVLSLPELWEYVDLSFGWCRPTNSILKSYSRTYWAQMESLSLQGCSTITEIALVAIAENCPKLWNLNLSYCTGFRDSGLADVLVSMLHKPLNENSKPLCELNMSFIEISPKGSGLDNVLRRILLEQALNPTEGPVLKSLRLAGCPMLSHLPFKAVLDASVAARKPLLGAVELLCLDGSAGLTGHFTLNIVRLQLAAPNLRSLQLSHVARATGWQPSVSTAGLPEEFSADRAMWSDLRSLQITEASASLQSRMTINVEYVFQMLRNSPVLDEIALFGFRHVHLDNLMQIFHPFTATGQPKHGLKRLVLDGTFSDFLNPSWHQLFATSYFQDTLEELSVIGSRYSFNDQVCEELASKYPKLKSVNARETAITEQGVRALVKSAQRRGLLETNGDGGSDGGGGGGMRNRKKAGFDLNIDSCRSVDRKIRQAASKGIYDLVEALGL